MTSKLDQLTAISPIDGRYYDQTNSLSNYFSEFALIKTRAEIELKYLLLLSRLRICRKFSKSEIAKIEKIYTNFSLNDAKKVKKFEEKTRHDVKALEYFLRKEFVNSSLSNSLNWLHFGLTSYDINDNAYRLMINRALKNVLIPEIEIIVKLLKKISRANISLPMLGRTHGQAAVPTTLGKEIEVFVLRIEKELNKIKRLKLFGKFSGSVGSWNSLHFIYPNKNWPSIATKFLKSLGLEISKITTQIAPADDLAELFQNIYRMNTVIIDLNQDVWRYISDDWIMQKGKDKDVGSSTMPQKVNPIEFENSEGNLSMANGIFETLSRKLPISRLQRDLSDSTVLRNIGLVFAHCLIAYKSCQKGLTTISPNKVKMAEDLNSDWAILTEALQTMLRKNGNADAYEKVASQVRGKSLGKKEWINLIESTNLSKEDREKLLNLKPNTYLGYSNKIRP